MFRAACTVVLLFGLIGQAFAADLRLTRVILSSGGVGYFEYAADIDGTATLGLDVPLGQVDDVLKSLVVFDSSGAVAGVELPGRDDTVQAFDNAPFGPDALDSPTAYLNALRGVEVTVQGPRPMTGRIVRAEPVTETIGKASTQRTRVTLLSADGLRQFVLEDADNVQVTDPDLRARIAHALEALRANAGHASRHLTVQLNGTGRRSVAVGYVAGAPLWKATYRMVLPAGALTTARLQGWATLENQSGSDWKSVALTLQYGNPVAFRQALYRSYFVQRPEVPVEILGHVLPDIDTRAKAMAAAAPMQEGMTGTAARGFAMAAPMAPPGDTAAAEETGDETIFTLAQPVDLPAGHSANLPILDREVPAQRVGLVPFMQPHPLASVRIKNDDPHSLPAGVLTIYDTTSGAVSFAGDARLGGLPSGETRLLSFARDLRTAIETTVSARPETLTAYSVAEGVLSYTMRRRQVIGITANAPLQAARDLLLEIPRSGSEETLGFEDGNTQPAEQTATAFRIPLSLQPGEIRRLTVLLDQPERRTVALLDGDDTMLQLIVAADALDPVGRDALRHVLGLRQDLARKVAARDQLHARLDDVRADEDRIRKNLGAVGPSDALRSRLTQALDADETEIGHLRASIGMADALADAAHRTLADAVAALRI